MTRLGISCSHRHEPILPCGKSDPVYRIDIENSRQIILRRPELYTILKVDNFTKQNLTRKYTKL